MKNPKSEYNASSFERLIIIAKRAMLVNIFFKKFSVFRFSLRVNIAAF